MKAGYQNPDFETEEFGDLSRNQLIDLIRGKDWTVDLMRFAGLSALGKETCPPNFHVQIGARTAATIVPSGIGRFTAVAGIGTGPKWMCTGKSIEIENVGIDEVETILDELERGQFAALKQRYAP
jgi:hypothetical protein